MKKWMLLLVAVLLLCSCGKKEETPAQTDPASSVTPVEEKNKTEAYLEKMEDYEILRVAFLGVEEEGRTLYDVLIRASEELGYDFIPEIDEKHLVYGEVSEEANNVYLFIPNSHCTVTIGEYDEDSGEMEDIYFKEEDCEPVIYVEECEMMEYTGMVSCVRDNDPLGPLTYLTGLTSDGRLRTDYIMGLVDVTDYSFFTNSEIPFLSQGLFDVLCYQVGEIRDRFENGKPQLSYMEDAYISGDVYAVYALQEEGKEDRLFAVRIDPDDLSAAVLSLDPLSGWESVILD